MKSTGTKIRKIAMVVEVVGIILTLFLAISIWVTGCESKSSRYSSYYSSYYSSSSSSDENQAAITGFIILIAGISGSVCSGILIDGFGELVENSAITNKDLERLTAKQMTEKQAEDIIKKYILNSRETTKQPEYVPQSNIAEQKTYPSTTAEVKQDIPQLNVVVQKPVTSAEQRPVTSAETQQFWKCPECGTTNFAERTECYNCHTKVKIKT